MSVKEPSSPTYNEARDQSPKVATKKGKRKSCMRHCKRFWWAYLIAFICIVVLVVCLIIFVAVPKIAQSKIDEAELEIQGVHILRTESDAYRLEINSTIRTDGHIKAKIYPFQGVMYLEDEPDHTPFVAIDFPETSGAKLQRVNVSQDIKIEDLPAFTEFNVQFHNNKTLRVTVDGKTKVKPSGLSKKYDVNFKKTLEIDGLNVFAGTKVLGGELDIEEEKEEGKNFHGTADIPNASDFTLDIGNVSFSNFVNGTLLGHLFIQDLLLVPGSNVVNISAKIDAIKTTGFLRSSQYCHDGGVLPFEMLGDNVTNHGENISYFAAALASVNQTVPINIGDIIADSLGTEVKCASED